MLKPLHSANTQAQDIQFTHFGVLELKGQSKSSLFTSIAFNLVVVAILLILSAAAVKVNADRRKEELTFVAVKPVEPLKPKVIPPKPLPTPPVIKLVEPKIVLPKITPPELPKPIPVNHDVHPTAVALGSANNPIHPSDRPATSAVNLGQRGLAGMPSTNTGGGPPSARVNLGSGQPNGSLSGTGSRGVVGVKLGVNGGTPGGTGNGVGTRAAQVQLGQNQAPPASAAPSIQKVAARTSPQVLYKPRPAYTEAATQAKIEGVVSVRIRVSANGAVTVLGVTNGLPYGLNDSAVRAVQATRFRPAVDANGSPVDWEGVVNISFQMAG